MHSLPEPALAETEEHLLVCSRCQDQLKEIEAYVTAMREAAARLHTEEESRKRFWTRVSGGFTFRRIGWAMAIAAVVLAGVALRISSRPPQSLPAFALMLETSRGSGMQHAPAGRPLHLSLDIRGLASFPTYELEVVNDAGRVQAKFEAAIEQSTIRITLPGSLGRGDYFIRIYSPARDLLREYGLHLD